jgi:hypothetical protein
MYCNLLYGWEQQASGTCSPAVTRLKGEVLFQTHQHSSLGISFVELRVGDVVRGSDSDSDADAPAGNNHAGAVGGGGGGGTKPRRKGMS